MSLEYKISEEHCRKMICGVCDYCGGRISPIETVDNAGNPTYWSSCKPCGVFTTGVPVRIYNVAKLLVVEHSYVHYNHLLPEAGDSEEMLNYKQNSQISGACSTVRQVLVLDRQLDVR